MKIYLPLKDDLLDHGDANSTWGNSYNSALIPTAGKIIGNVKCAEFSKDTRLAITNKALISSLTTWTLQLWFYPYIDRSSSSSAECVLVSNYPYGQSGNSTNVYVSLFQGNFIVCNVYLLSSIAINTWHQLYMTCDGTNIDIYYDNQTKQTIPRGSKGFTAGLTIGNEQGNFGWDIAFRGGITQFCLSDKYNDERLGLLSQVIYLSENKEVYGMI